MVAIYVLKLKRGKYYVGMTRRNIDRVLDHIDGKGAAWTKKYPPSETKPILSFQENLRESDENRITLETMAKYGVRNVRGGDWCRVRLPIEELRALEKKIGKKTTKKNTAKKSPKRKVTCGRCGRIGHIRTKCHLKTTVDGVKITTKTWKYRPKKATKSDSKKKLRVVCARCFRIGHESKNCRARTKLNPNSILVKMEIRGLPIR